MADFSTLVLDADSRGLDRGVKSLDNLTKSAAKAEDAAQDMSAATTRAAASTQALGGSASGVQQKLRGVTQQLSQVGQQTMATGNFVQALAIQLPDIGLAFGAVGTAAGLVAGIALPMLIGALGGATDSGKALRDAVDNLASGVESLNAITANYSADGLQSLVEKYGEVNGQILTLIERQRGVVLNETLEAARVAAAALRDELSGGFFSTDEAAIAEKLGVELSIVENGFRMINPVVEDFQQKLSNIETATGFDQQADAISAMLSAMEAAGMETGDLYNALVDAEAASRQLANSAPNASWMSAAVSGVNGLIGKLWDAVAAKNALAATPTERAAAISGGWRFQSRPSPSRRSHAQ